MNKNNIEYLHFDVAIIGSGPSGLNCALYASRGNLKVAFIDKSTPGGKITSTAYVDNWIGTQDIKGYELATSMYEHALKYGAKFVFGEVVEIKILENESFEVILKNNKILISKIVVIASGMENRIPHEIKNIEKFSTISRGVSYCVVCDGPFYKNKPAAIIGGGDSALEEGIYLSNIASTVDIFVRKDYLRAEQIFINEASKIPNIKIHFNSQVKELIGDKELEEIIVVENNEIKKYKINHLYPYIGFIPNISFAKHFDIFNENGFIKVNYEFETKIKNLFAIGDVIDKKVRQIVTAASDGAIVGKNIINKINEK